MQQLWVHVKTSRGELKALTRQCLARGAHSAIQQSVAKWSTIICVCGKPKPKPYPWICKNQESYPGQQNKTIPHLRWGSNNAMNTNRCSARTHPPCRSYCIQIAILCANNENWKELCNHIECPPPSVYSCIPGPYEQPESEECAMYNIHSDLRSRGPLVACTSSWVIIFCTLLIIGIRRGV